MLWQRFLRKDVLKLKKSLPKKVCDHALKGDLFEGVHLGAEVRGLEHPQEDVQPQIIHHVHQLPLEPHTQQLNGGQKVWNAHQPLCKWRPWT